MENWVKYSKNCSGWIGELIGSFNRMLVKYGTRKGYTSELLQNIIGEKFKQFPNTCSMPGTRRSITHLAVFPSLKADYTRVNRSTLFSMVFAYVESNVNIVAQSRPGTVKRREEHLPVRGEYGRE
jgi:hypothetical protein